MKTYLFAIHNWKSGNKPFWYRKRFPSAYAADRWAMKMTFAKARFEKPYTVIFCPGLEE